MTDILARVPKPVMVMRSLRVPEPLWEAAKAKADEREENISDVIRNALELYAAEDTDASTKIRKYIRDDLEPDASTIKNRQCRRNR